MSTESVLQLDNGKLTPLMQQYFEFRAQHPDALLLFQVGDFFELFFQDAQVVSQFLAITLTKRGKCNGQDIPICGVPMSAINPYLVRLVKGGFKVAICEQVGKAIPGQLVRRQVTRVLTPGTLTDSAMLDDKKSSYLCALWPGSEDWGLLFAEMLGQQIYATWLPAASYKILEGELARFSPDEIIMPAIPATQQHNKFFAVNGYSINLEKGLDSNLDLQSPEEIFDLRKNANLWQMLGQYLAPDVWQRLQQRYCYQGSLAVLASYLSRYHAAFLRQVKDIHFYQAQDFLTLDAATLRNLEVVSNNQTGSSKNSLFNTLDLCKTAMGSRLLKRQLLFPLKDKNMLLARQYAVGAIKASVLELNRLEKYLQELPDLQRIVGRIALDKAQLSDLVHLLKVLLLLPKLKTDLAALCNDPLLFNLFVRLQELPHLVELLQASLADVDQEGSNGSKIRSGFDFALDHAQSELQELQQRLLALELHENSLLSVGSSILKLRYTDQQGYFWEVGSNHLAKVPAHFVLQQSLVGRSRFTTAELKDLEGLIQQLQTQLQALEEQALQQVFERVKENVASLRNTSQALAELDFLFALANAAYLYNYVRPQLVDDPVLIIYDGRHPVVERQGRMRFVPNDTLLNQEQRTAIITGPNMGGKSTYLRQVAHIVIMAQVGGFVPASACTLGLFDRIFTRIGSGDNLAEGKSTFLIEMEEVATICQLATKNSLVILDEVGRGTSTYDGLALAQAILEFVYHQLQAKTLFATHYHELTKLADILPGASNFWVTCHQIDERLVFLHKVEPGVAKASFGIQVAKLAGLPDSILMRAKDLLKSFGGADKVVLDVARTQVVDNLGQVKGSVGEVNLGLAQLVERLLELDLNNISFRQAYDLLEAMQRDLQAQQRLEIDLINKI